MANIELWTDGSSTGAVGPGGWAYILRFQRPGQEEWVEREESGYMPDTTNQRMEMIAMLMGLRALKRRCAVTVYTDSAYLMNAWLQGWIIKWRRNGWKAGRGSKAHPVENRDVWEALIEEKGKHLVNFTKVKGHDASGRYPINDRVDKLAVAARKAGDEKFVTVELPFVGDVDMSMAV